MTPGTLCEGSSGCGHPRSEHRVVDRDSGTTMCVHPIANGRATCSCVRFKEVRGSSSVPKANLHG
jgi:hypothetical protein